MPDLYDVSHLWGEDIDETPSGDLALTTRSDRTVRRLVRRLMTVATTTASSDYPWQPRYGAGLGARIGQALDVRGLQAVVMSQVLLEPSVARTPLPQVDVSPIGTTGAIINVTYTDSAGASQNFSFNVSEPGA